MSAETRTTLATQTLIGMTENRGNAWHWRKGDDNHYAGPVPEGDVIDRLFNWSAVTGEVTATALTDTGVLRSTATDKKAVMHSQTGQILGIHGSTYRVHQYRDWLLTNVSTLLDTSDLVIGTAGVLQGGRKAWVQIELRETLDVKGEKYRPFLTAATSHDGSMATSYVTGVTRVVCDNTLSAALRRPDTKFKVRHSTNSLSKIGQARDALGIVYEVADNFAAEVADLTSQVVTDTQWADFVAAYTAGTGTSERSKSMAENKARELYGLWNNDVRVAPWKGSAYGVLQAVNTYGQHSRTVKGMARSERNMLNAINGATFKEDQAALDLLATV
jgi:phage/plasmid-like protein (TIGR03299 family)